MSQPLDPHRSAPAAAGPTGGVVGDDGVIRYGSAADPATTAVPRSGEIDANGGIFYPGDEETSRAPGAALVLLVLSLVAGGLYVWLFWPQKSSFDWASALTLKTPEFAVVGGLIMWGGGVLFIRHGLIWASRLGAIVTAVPMTRELIDSLTDSSATVAPGAAGLSFLLGGGPALLVLALSFSPELNRWRRRRQATVAAEAQERREKRARIARAAGGGHLN